MAEYPKDLFHPNGFQTVTVWNPEQEQKAYDAQAAWRQTHDSATLAALQGHDAPHVEKAATAPVMPTPTPAVVVAKPAGAK